MCIGQIFSEVFEIFSYLAADDFYIFTMNSEKIYGFGSFE